MENSVDLRSTPQEKLDLLRSSTRALIPLLSGDGSKDVQSIGPSVARVFGLVSECLLLGIRSNIEEALGDASVFSKMLDEIAAKESDSFLATTTIPAVKKFGPLSQESCSFVFVILSTTKHLLIQHIDLLERNEGVISKFYDEKSIVRDRMNRIAFSGVLMGLDMLQYPPDLEAYLLQNTIQRTNIEPSTPAHEQPTLITTSSPETAKSPRQFQKQNPQDAKKRFSATVSPLSYYYQEIKGDAGRSSPQRRVTISEGKEIIPSGHFDTAESSTQSLVQHDAEDNPTIQSQDKSRVVIPTKSRTRKKKASSTESGQTSIEQSISSPTTQEDEQQSSRFRFSGTFKHDMVDIKGDLRDVILYDFYFSDIVLKNGEIQAPRILSDIYTLKLSLHFEVHEPGTRTMDSCFGCKYKFDGFLKRPRFCYYTGQYFCTRCHINEKSIIPGRVVHLWDFELYPVCNLAQEVIIDVASTPVIKMEELNGECFNRTEALKKCKALRICINRCNDYLSTCQHSETLSAFLGDRLYMLFSTNEYALVDLVDLEKGHLIPHLQYVANHFQDHIFNSCESCRSKGDYCDICQSGDILYSFLSETVSQCLGCGAYTHRKCLASIRKCLKCDRMQKRKNRAALFN